MIEQGFVSLITSGLNNASPPVFPIDVYGFPVQLPKDFISASNPKAWTYRTMGSDPLYTLDGEDPLTGWRVAIDCHGLKMADAIALSRAIDGLLSGGWSGTLTDPNNTVVQGVFNLSGSIDGFSDADRSYVRTTSYVVKYVQS